MKKFIMLIGPSGSGKSTWADTYINIYHNTVIVSSDRIRYELYGDESIQTNPQEVFRIARERTLFWLEKGMNVIFDATNLSLKDRRTTLECLKKFELHRIAMVFAIPYYRCVENQLKRSRKVDSIVIDCQIKKFQIPVESENFDETYFVRDDSCIDDFGKEVFEKVSDFDQMNSHHSLKLLDHCLAAAQNLPFTVSCDSELFQATATHDFGKAYTQIFFDLKGNPSEDAHYYGHDNYGAYLYCCCAKETPNLYVAQLINYHMIPYFTKTSKSQEKWRKRLGNKLWNDILTLNAADKRAK